MFRNQRLLFPLLLIAQWLPAQTYKVSGRVMNNRLEPLALVSIQVKGEKLGVLTREDGQFELSLEKGQYDLVFSMIGFKPRLITLAVTADYTQNFILEPDDKDLSEVVVTGKLRDRSEEIIRQVIRHKDELLAAAGAFSCQVYIRATQQDSLPPKKRKGRTLPDTLRNRPEAWLQGMSMAEISLRYDHETDTRFKQERMGVVKRGNPESLFYLSLTDGDFNLYHNLLRSPILSEVPFLSPVSYSGLSAYRYKLLSTKIEKGRKIYTIGIRPRQLSNVTVEGELTILDSAWVVLDARFTLPGFHIPEYDRFEVIQHYSLIHDTAWMIDRQQFRYFSRHGKGKLSGETVAVYHDFELNKTFPKRYFGTEISATTQEAYERDSSFWEKTRTEPLTPREVRFIQFKDSLYRVTHARAYLDSVDRITNRVTWKKVMLTGQPIYSREKERTWVLPSLLSFYQPFELGGARVSPTILFSKIEKSRKNISIFANISYGFRNKDINGSVDLERLYNPFTRAFFRVRLGRDFQYIFEGDAWINMIQRSNQYLNNSFGLGHGVELVNGLFLYTDVDFALRRSVANYKTNSKIDSLLGDILDNNTAVAFDPYNAAYGKIRLQYTPAQRYMREPREKVILGSNWPTFYTTWRKGIPGIMNSKVDFDYLEFGMEQELRLGVTGISKYNIKTGTFLSKRDLRLVDYQFQRRGDPILFMNPHEAFQSLDSTFPVFKRFYQAHYLHEFNGAILNKIPLLKKLELREIAGGGFLYAPERNLRYAELFAGVERIFKVPFNPLIKFKLGVYIIGSAANQFHNPIQFKIGITTWDRRRNKWL